MRNFFLLIAVLFPSFVSAQVTATDEEAYTVSLNYAKKYLNILSPNVTVVNQPSFTRPLYEISIGNGLTFIVSSDKKSIPILAVVKNDGNTSMLGNPNLPVGMQYFIEKYCGQILYAMGRGENFIHPQWEELLYDECCAGDYSNRTIYGPYLTTAWGQNRPNDTPWEAAFNYYVETTDNSCQGGDMGHKCPTGCVATAMAQIMKYWNYPVFRAGRKTQYDWCNMPDSLTTFLQPTTMLNPYYERQRNAIARLMADCGEAAQMHYCCHDFIVPNRCESFTWPYKARNALVDSFQYSSDAVRLLRSDYLTQPDTWKNFLIQDLQNGRLLIYAGASYAIGGYEQDGHAFVCDGYNEGTDLFHFNWGDLSDGAWCALDAIIVDNNNYNHLERAVFNIHPSSSENHCDFDLELWYHYMTYYTPFQTTPHPYQNVPPTATRLFSVPTSVPNGSGTYYFADSLRTIPSGATSEYVAHKEVVLRPGFTAENGCDFVARIEPCAECEGERGQSHPMEVTNATPRRDVARNVSTTTNGNLRLHPNPTTHTLTVETTSPIRTLTVYDLAGRVMMTVDGGANNHSPLRIMDVSSLPNGIYLLRAVTDSGVETGRFVKN
ncbi:MAG: C10 family peptidase [Bacteroidales bacterium]|nr:C10 family peptidase [Bacteroidales bacterium]